MKVYTAIFVKVETNEIICLGTFSTLKNAEDTLINYYRKYQIEWYTFEVESGCGDEVDKQLLQKYKTASDIELFEEMTDRGWYIITRATVDEPIEDTVDLSHFY